MKEQYRLRHYRHAPTPEDPDPITNCVDWGARTIVTADGEVVNVHAEKDRAAYERDRTLLAERAALSHLEGVKAEHWLSRKVTLESEKKKATTAQLDREVAAEQDKPESAIGVAYLAYVEAEAAAKNANRIYWMLVGLTGLDLRRQT